MKLKVLSLFLLLVLFLSTSCVDKSNQFIPISREEYETAFKQCSQYNFIPDTTVVDLALRHRLQRVLMKTNGGERIWIHF